MRSSLSEALEEGEYLMKRDMMLREELKKFQKMKEEMEILWDELFFETPNHGEEEIWIKCERLPKFEGVGRTSSHPKYKNVK